MTPARREVWLFDLGMAEKVRPALVVSVRYGSRYEIPVDVPFLKPGAFLVQSVATYPNVRAIRKLGTLKPEQFEAVFVGLLGWLGHPGG